MWLFPWLSLLAIGGMGAVLVAMAFTPALEQDFKASCVTVIVAVLAYGAVRSRRQVRGAKLALPVRESD